MVTTPETTEQRSASSSFTITDAGQDVEAQPGIRVNPKSSIVFHYEQAGVTQQVLDWNYRGSGTEDDPYIVDFIENDPKNPLTIRQWRKWINTFAQAFAVFAVSFASSAFTGGITEVIEEFEISEVVATLGVSLFVVGFALGPLIWAPMSEIYGRQLIFAISYSALTALLAGSAASPNIQSLVVLRFFAGIFGSSPLTNSGAVIADMFEAKERGMATAIFAAAPFLGPTMGPIAGGFLGDAAGWRWVCGLLASVCGLMLIIVMVIVPETYAPVLLRRRAEKLSKMRGKVYKSKLETDHTRKSVGEVLKKSLSRPWIMLFQEPIVLIISLYTAIVYGTLYMMFGAFPIVFQENRGWNAGVGGLPFAGVALGMFVSIAYCIQDNTRFAKIIAEKGKSAPEDRLPPSIFGSLLLPVGLFWFAWSNGPEVHWIVPIIASAFFGSGLVLVFLSLTNYLIDSYVVFAASVLAANSVIRSLFGAAFPLFTDKMFVNLGIHWASSIPAFLSLLCVPFPYLFYKHGASIRMKCRFAAEAANELEKVSTRTDTDPNAEYEAWAEVEETTRHRREAHEEKKVEADINEKETAL
ncbi:major facilitator superfamily domain-containing protein [Xylariales sp. PMI_506]|nr:major facilitator superfamily domain-containing protein [Xylariales sp. PMI_506]